MESIPTGCKGIDMSLMGGIPLASVTLVYGEEETGKTTFAMQCAVNCAKRGHKTMFVDSERTFSSRRLSQITFGNSDEISELIILARPVDFKEQTIIVDQLNDYISSNFKLVIFDTMTSLYRLQIAETPSKTFQLNRELNRQLAFLAQTAKTQKIGILVTSQVHAVFNEPLANVAPVGTRVLNFWADVVIALKHTEDPQIIKAELEKSPSKPMVTGYELRIEKSGIHDYRG